MDKLSFYRRQIDKLDSQIIMMLVDRLNVSRNVGEYKRSINMQVLSQEREEEILKKLEEYPYSPQLREVYHAILHTSKELQG